MAMDDIALGNLIHRRIFGSDEQREKEKERKRNEATEAQTLRKFLSLQDEARKDDFTAMDLASLRGELMHFTEKQRTAKERQERLDAAALEQLLADTGEETTSLPSPGLPGILPDLNVRTRRPVSVDTIRAGLPRHPRAANAPNLPDLLNALRASEPEPAEEGGKPLILPGPFANTRIVTDARGRSTPQVVREDKAAEGYIEVPDPDDPVYGPKIRLPLSQAMKEFPHLLNRLKPAGAAAPASNYKTADEVKAAYKSGKLTKEAAAKLLREQFQMK